MAETRKPIPKSQRQISEELQTPLDPGGIGFQPTGNPNDLDITVNSKANAQSTGIEFNRATKFSFKDDTVKPFSVGIEDIERMERLDYASGISKLIVDKLIL